MLIHAVQQRINKKAMYINRKRKDKIPLNITPIAMNIYFSDTKLMINLETKLSIISEASRVIESFCMNLNLGLLSCTLS